MGRYLYVRAPAGMALLRLAPGWRSVAPMTQERDPLPPFDWNAPPVGGGNPNVRDLSVSSPPQLRDENSEGLQVTDVIEPHPLAEMLADSVPEPEDIDLPVRWNGAPTRRALQMLKLESRARTFDLDAAVLLLEAMNNGQTLTQALEVAGLRRSVVNAWRALVPEFDALVTQAEKSLGSYFRDRAAQVAMDDAGDPQRIGALLKVAGAFDRAIAKGEADEGSGGGTQVVVNLARF